MKSFVCPLLLLFSVLGVAAAEDPAVPAPRTKEYSWMKVATWNARHEQYLARAKEGKCDLLFLGDSITEGWGNNETWKKRYEPRNAVNFGIGGDTTQNVLWRITNGELEGLAPKAIVLMIVPLWWYPQTEVTFFLIAFAVVVLSYATAIAATFAILELCGWKLEWHARS